MKNTKNKHSYKTIDVQQLELPRLVALLPAVLVIVAVDVAKKRQVAAFCDPQGHDQLLVRFEHPEQTPQFMGMLKGLQTEHKKVELVMEPTGTYGDILCYQGDALGVDVYQVSPKRTHDAAEVFDGVPSYHDAKDATVIGRLHAQGVSQRWRPSGEQKREARALVARREVHARQHEVLHGILEGLLARHWPEAEQVLEVRQQKRALALLASCPDPRQVAAQREQVRELMNKTGRRRLTEEQVQELMEAAEQTQGVPLVGAEVELLKEVARELLRTGQRIKELDGELKQAVSKQPKLARVAALFGATTVAVFFGYLGDLGAYSSPGALEKAMGLNLKEASSGRQSARKYRPGVHITKRGPGIVRKYLYLATLRWMQQDWIAAAWYQGRKAYTEEAKGRAVVALMRKLVRGLWHVSRGDCYDPERLFDVRRLAPRLQAQMASPASQEVTM